MNQFENVGFNDKVRSTNPILTISYESNKNNILSIHPLMEITELVCIVFEYCMSSTVCEAFENLDQNLFYTRLKEHYKNLHIICSFGNSLDSILICLNSENIDKDKEYCVLASQKVRGFVKNKLLHEIEILENSELCDHNSQKSNFYNLIKVKKEKLRVLETKPDLFIDDEVAKVNQQLDKSYELIFDIIKTRITLPSSFESLKELCASDECDKYLTELTTLNLIPKSESQALTILPNEIGRLKYLKHLNIAENRIQYLPNSITNLDLSDFYARNNNLQQLPKNFPPNQNLICFDINNSKINNINHIFHLLPNVWKLGISIAWEGLLSKKITNLSQLKGLWFDDLDLLFPYIDQLPLNLRIFPSVSYLLKNAHLFPNNIVFHQEMGIGLAELRKIKACKIKLEKERIKKEKFENEKIKETQSRTCIIS